MTCFPPHRDQPPRQLEALLPQERKIADTQTQSEIELKRILWLIHKSGREEGSLRMDSAR
jgi:hypothetical protein